MAYPAASALQDASELPALKGLSDGELDDVYQLGIASIEDFCGQSFVEEEEIRVLDGGGGKTVALDKRLAELTTLTVAGSSLQTTDVHLNDRHSELMVNVEASGGNWVERTLREDMRPMFSAGPGTVTIDGIWGWLDTELDPMDLSNKIARALRLDMEDQALLITGPLAEVPRRMAKMRSERLSEGPLTVTTSQSIVPLSSGVQALLSDYVWQPAARVA
jgi:hypothetical protein